MPKLKRGSGGGLCWHEAKAGTKNKHQAAARDKRAADAAEVELQAAAEALAALDEPAPAPAEEQPSTEPEPAYEPSKGEMDAYKRMEIASKYLQVSMYDLVYHQILIVRRVEPQRQLLSATFNDIDQIVGTFGAKPRTHATSRPEKR